MGEMVQLANTVKRLVGVCTAVGGGFLIGVMLLVVANIIVRLLGGAILGTYELVELMIVVTASFAIVYTALRQGHVVVNIVMSRFSQRTQAIIESSTLVVGIGTWLLVAWANVGLIREGLGQRQLELLKIPHLPFRYVWLFALTLLCLVLTLDLFKTLSRTVKK